MSKPASGCSAVPLPMKIRTKSGTGRAAIAGDVTALPDVITAVTGRDSGAVARGDATVSGSTRLNHDDTSGATANCLSAGGARRDFPRSTASATEDVTDGAVGPRGVERDGLRCGSVDGAPRDDTADESGPDEPRDPEESASAKGIATAAEPTPSATASAPTRPT